MLWPAYEHEALTEANWDEALNRFAIDRIVAGAELAELGGFWPGHLLDDVGEHDHLLVPACVKLRLGSLVVVGVTSVRRQRCVGVVGGQVVSADAQAYFGTRPGLAPGRRHDP
jgi:hypothetical protein